MRGVKSVFDFYLNSSMHVALAVVSLGILSYLEYGLVVEGNLLMFIFFGSVTGYNFVKYAGIAKLHHASLAKNLKLIQIFSFLCFLAFFYSAFQQEFKVLLIASLLGFFTLLYAIPLGKSKQNLRNIGGIKIFIIAFVWAGVCVLLPLYGQIPIKDLMLSFFQRFVFVIAITLPFEIRDLKFDAAQLYTIPQQIGVKNTRRTGYLLLVVMLLLELLKKGFSPINFFTLLFIVILSGFFIKFALVRQGKYYSSFWVESIPVIWLLIGMVMKALV